MTNDDENDEWMDEDRGDDDAPHPSESTEDDSPREAIGYREPNRNGLQVALQGVSFARGATIAPTGHSVRGPGVCAQCGRSYAIRMLNECPHCQANRNRRVANELAAVIRELKAGRAAPDRERHLVKQLRELGHPHIPEFLAALEARNQSAVTKPRSRL